MCNTCLYAHATLCLFCLKNTLRQEEAERREANRNNSIVRGSSSGFKHEVPSSPAITVGHDVQNDDVGDDEMAEGLSDVSANTMDVTQYRGTACDSTDQKDDDSNRQRQLRDSDSEHDNNHPDQNTNDKAVTESDMHTKPRLEHPDIVPFPPPPPPSLIDTPPDSPDTSTGSTHLPPSDEDLSRIYQLIQTGDIASTRLVSTKKGENTPHLR